MSIECIGFGTMPVPCSDHVRTMFGLALLPDQLSPEILKTEQHRRRPMSRKCLLFGTMPGPCLDHFVTMLLQDQLELCNFED